METCHWVKLQNRHPSKVMLEIILKYPQAEEIITEEQARLRTGRSSTEQIFNLRIVCETYLQYRQNYHTFMDIKACRLNEQLVRGYSIHGSIIRVVFSVMVRRALCTSIAFHLVMWITSCYIWATSRENLFLPSANNNAQISLCMRAVWSASLLFAAWIV